MQSNVICTQLQLRAYSLHTAHVPIESERESFRLFSSSIDFITTAWLSILCAQRPLGPVGFAVASSDFGVSFSTFKTSDRITPPQLSFSCNG